MSARISQILSLQTADMRAQIRDTLRQILRSACCYDKDVMGVGPIFTGQKLWRNQTGLIA